MKPEKCFPEPIEFCRPVKFRCVRCVPFVVWRCFEQECECPKCRHEEREKCFCEEPRKCFKEWDD